MQLWFLPGSVTLDPEHLSCTAGTDKIAGCVEDQLRQPGLPRCIWACLGCCDQRLHVGLLDGLCSGAPHRCGPLQKQHLIIYLWHRSASIALNVCSCITAALWHLSAGMGLDVCGCITADCSAQTGSLSAHLLVWLPRCIDCLVACLVHSKGVLRSEPLCRLLSRPAADHKVRFDIACSVLANALQQGL